MIKILIMDDEYYVREGLKCILKFSNIDCEICAEVDNGIDGYKKIMELKPHVVLIDINMPGKYGIDVIKEARENKYEGEFIIISGYSDFKYAQRAIKYDVKNYLLKPIDEGELIQIISNIKKQICIKQLEEKKSDINKEILKQFLVGQYLIGKKFDAYGDIISEFKEGIFEVGLMVNSLRHNNFDSTLEIESLLLDIAKDIKDIRIVRVDELIAIIFQGRSDGYVNSLLVRFKTKINNLIGGKTFVALGTRYKGIENLVYSYRDAKKLMKHQFLFQELSVLSIENIQENNHFKELDEAIILEKILEYVEIGEVAKFEENLEILKNIFKAKLCKEEVIKKNIINYLLEFGIKMKKDYDIQIYNNEILIDEIYSKEDLVSTIEFLKLKLSDISEKINGDTANNSIKKIVRYIEKNYYKDLKLELLAEIFSYNSAYLGKVFKNYTGEGFNIYLDKVRIGEAKKLLLENNLKVYQVCDMVGYKNIDYFHSKFKKYVGMSPLNYKKNFGNDIIQNV